MVSQLDDMNGIAVIGMAGRFPNSKDIYQFWDNLINARECISFFSDEEMLSCGVAPEVINNPRYIKAKGILDSIDLFDPSFFGINPKEAELTDPQHRLMLECAWEALENAGYSCSKYKGHIGVFAGCGMNIYLLMNVLPHIDINTPSGTLIAAIGNDKDSLTTLISYRMNLKGPSIAVQSSSSTSLVAVCSACLSLLTYQCDMALAGGVGISPPHKGGYYFEEGGILSPDGHCRPFDALSRGFVPGMGGGLVLLKRLSEAVRDRDNIWAVIKGFAVNNDGSNKVSYSAPSVDMQAEVIIEAQALAEAPPETITYVEAHGTATTLGDPIELTALTQAFRAKTDKKQFCAIGSVKGNIGHLDTASGIAGLIKTCLSLKHKKIPPSINCSAPNPKIDFEQSPFFVNTKLQDWETSDFPRRAGVTSLGMGGTNAHVILEEMDTIDHFTRKREKKDCYLILQSAKTSSALEVCSKNLVDFLTKEKDYNIADVAYTLAVGRDELPSRRAFLIQDIHQLLDVRGSSPPKEFTAHSDKTKKIVFMFTGQGSQYINMGWDIYIKEKVFKETFDNCVKIYKQFSGIDISDIVFTANQKMSDPEKINQTQYAQPVLFILEYSLSRLLMSWGVTPSYMIGHSIGEYVAACLSGVVTLENALFLVYTRANLMQNQTNGSMLAVGLEEFQLAGIIKSPQYVDLSIAAVNSPKLSVVSGNHQTINRLKAELEAENIFCEYLNVSHAFDPVAMEPMLEHCTSTIRGIVFTKPRIPYISCVSGTWINDAQASDYHYWVSQIKSTVRFSDGIKEILNAGNSILIEIGPGDTLASLAKLQVKEQSTTVLTSIPAVKSPVSSYIHLHEAIARIWVNNGLVEWDKYYSDAEYFRVPLPTYPFERKSYWIGQGICRDERISQPVQGKAPVVLGDSYSKSQDSLKNIDTSPQAIEKTVIQIWEDLLGLKPVHAHDDFFELGGHSLLATQMFSRIEYIYGVKISLKETFYDFNVSRVSEIIRARL